MTRTLARLLALLNGDHRRQRENDLLAYLTAHPDSFGLQICQDLGWSAASLYPLLGRLEDEGRITARWGNLPFPRGRLFRATPTTKA